MDEIQENLRAAIEALEQQIKRLAQQANLYEMYQMQSGLKDYLKRERARKALALIQLMLSMSDERLHRNH